MHWIYPDLNSVLSKKFHFLWNGPATHLAMLHLKTPDFITWPIWGMMKSGDSRCNIAKWVAKFYFQYLILKLFDMGKFYNILFCICDVIKQNESELANTVFKIQPNKADSSYCFLLFVQSFNCLYLWNQLHNLYGVFTKLKPKQYPNRKCQKNKNHSFDFKLILLAHITHILSKINLISQFKPHNGCFH